MIPEKLFHRILALGDGWGASGVDYVEKEGQVPIRVEDRPELWTCPVCNGKEVGGYDRASERRWRHLNVCQLESEIVCCLARGR